ncbi:MAG: hypothetical protein LBS29_02405 [Endomicrobium sp.]|nr:hypothetical protein [Endomicrobium sp.]
MLKNFNLVNVTILKTNLNNEKDNISKIIDIAKSKKAQIITKDFEVYKIASLEKVAVLNFNNLEMALYPTFLPGQKVNVYLVKEGSQHDQAIGYFDEKTTVVQIDGKSYIDRNTQIVVTSSIFSSNGKLVFGRILRQ